MRKKTASNDRWLQQLEKRLALADDPLHGPISEEDRAIVAEAEDMIGGPDDRGKPPRSPEFIELAITRALQKQGRPPAYIAQKIEAYKRDSGRGEG